MLKIYRATIVYEVVVSTKNEMLDTHSYYIIKDEKDAITHTEEYSAYSVEAATLYTNGCDIYEKKKGRKAIYRSWPGDVWLNEWNEPDAKLLMRVSYKQVECSMRELMDLSANDVIAYLKQEGINMILPS